MSRFKQFIYSSALVFIAISVFFISAEIFANLYDHLANVPIHPKDELRDDDIPRIEGVKIEKTPGTKRILVLGDSIAAGQAILKKETFSYRLEELINKDFGSKAYEVINTGFSGINTPEELNILLDKGPNPEFRPELKNMGYVGLAYRPEIILLQYTVENDAPLHNVPYSVAMPHRWEKDRARRYNYGEYSLPLPEGIDRWLTKNSKFYLFFLYKYHKLLTRFGLRSELAKIKMMYQDRAEGWQRTRWALYQIGLIAKEKKIPLLMVLWGTTNETPLKPYYKLVADFAAACGFRVLDLTEDIKWPDEDFAVSMVDSHPNGKANMIAAEGIYRFLVQERLLFK